MISYLQIVSLALLFSTTMANGVRRRNQEQETLGSVFLTAVESGNTDSPNVLQLDTSFDFAVKGETMASLSKQISDICKELGRIGYESSSSSGENNGEMDYYSMNCQFEIGETAEQAVQMMRQAITLAKPTSFSSSSNSNSYYNSPNVAGQQKGLEELLKLANTLEEVMLIVPSWQNAAFNYGSPGMSSININMNKEYVYNNTDDFMHFDEFGEIIEEEDDGIDEEEEVVEEEDDGVEEEEEVVEEPGK